MSKTSDEMLINWLQASLDDNLTTETVDDSDTDTDAILNNAWQKIKQDPVLIALFFKTIPEDQREFVSMDTLSEFLGNLSGVAKQVEPAVMPAGMSSRPYADPEQAQVINKGQIDTSCVTFARVDRMSLYDIEYTSATTWKDAIELVLGYFALHDPNKMIECFNDKLIDLVDKPDKVRRPLPVKNMNLWYESNKSAINIATDINKLIRYFGAKDHFEIEFHNRYCNQSDNFVVPGTKYHLKRTNRQTGRVWEAVCEEKDGKYILKAGSIISDQELLNCPLKIQKMRNAANISSNRVLMEDIEFDTLSDAASFVLATNAWGEREWKK